MNEELEYVLETIRFKTSIYRDKKKRNLTFNDDYYYSNILNEYITNLQQENARLKDKLNKINDLLNEPIFEYDNIPCNIENEIIQLKDIFKEN